jgi:hypothetical protein
MHHSSDERYVLAASSAACFQLLQLGVCTVKKRPDGWELSPFNLTLYPSQDFKHDKVFGSQGRTENVPCRGAITLAPALSLLVDFCCAKWI